MFRTFSRRSLAALAPFAPLALALAALVVTPSCDKKNDAPSTAGSAANSAAKPSGSTTTASAKKKLPGKKGHDVSQHAVKGGGGETLPTNASPTIPEAATDTPNRKKANVDKVDCTQLPDNAAECDGNNLYFCDDKQLWVVDCDTEAKHLDMQGGSCFEGDKFRDCMGCDTADDGTVVCCNADLSLCCDHEDCYSTK